MPIFSAAALARQAAGLPAISLHTLGSPPVALKATSWPPCEPSARSLVAHFSVELSAFRKAGPALRRQALGWRAGAAELLLLNRLRARTRRGTSRDTLERAARILEVTARHWFDEVDEGKAAPAAA